MGTWNFTAITRDIDGKIDERIRGQVSGPHPGDAQEAVREQVQERTGRRWVEVYVDDPYFD
ncbi:hypothetical protein [Streptomyces sp. NPDC050704]|uniref:hypothetical protein n=1 Tax=Streptomyces sp. NPDC050704 TaxID=3157219 RepID=UPI0034309AE8